MTENIDQINRGVYEYSQGRISGGFNLMLFANAGIRRKARHKPINDKNEQIIGYVSC